MTKYPLIEAMGLEYFELYYLSEKKFFVMAGDLEKALQNAQLWYGNPDSNSWSTVNIKHHNSHTARLVCIQPTKKQTKAEAALEFVNKLTDSMPGLKYCDFSDLMNEAKKILEMKD